jgi:uncharacterized membrane protein
MYLALKVLHIIAVILFLGNVITGAFWKLYGDKTGDPRIMAHTLEGISKSDRLFTIPGVVMIFFFGFATALVGHISILRSQWIWQSLIMFAVAGFAYAQNVVPLQIKMRQLALQGVNGSFDEAEYQRLSRKWNIWGSISILAPLIAVGLMVTKPV